MKHIIALFLCLSLVGCGNKISPLSPEMKQSIDNQNGKIDDIRNNQNGVMLELGKLRQQQDINARDIHNAQQGVINLRGAENSGVQIFSGDGGLILAFFLVISAGFGIYYYRNRAVKSEAATEIMAQQIVAHEDSALDEKVFLSALGTKAEEAVYHSMVRSKARFEKPI